MSIKRKMKKIEPKDIKVGDWLLITKNIDKKVKWVYKILKFRKNRNTIVDIYRTFGKDGGKEFKAFPSFESILPDWDLRTSEMWGVNKLNEEEIKKWKKIIIVNSL